ncbi:MFS transporter [Oceaniglobus roseus]|uniref:MFS transporter n=1 Tax=Oceaniglobus roseus TaxID=1737570 RepID=UPI000C7F3E16|nr:MFS transporter [Kandeliimicrobium roseum]
MSVTTSEPAPGGPAKAAEGERPAPRARWIAMAVLLTASFMNLIDVTIVNVALPSMKASLNASPSQIEWVVAIYILVFALCLLPGGRYGDIYGRRNVFMAGVVVFTLGSALCGLAPSIGVLVASRAVQAVGGAMMVPQTLALVPALFPPEERGAAFATFGLSAGLASVSGPLLGGVLIGADLWGLDWRPIFLVNVPVGVLAILLALRFLPKVSRRPDQKNDVVGIVVAGLALLFVVFPLIEGRQLGWPLWCFAMIAAALPMAALFVRWQKRQAARGGAQLLSAGLLANRNYLVGVLLTAILFSGMPSFFLIMALFLQDGFGLTPLQSGLTTVPFSVGVLMASLVAGRLGNRVLRARITTGASMMSLGMIWLWFLVYGIGEEVVSLRFLPPLLMAGFGLGTAISPLFNTVLASVSGENSGAASGALQAFQQVGGAMGVAIVGQIFFSRLVGSGPEGSATSHDAYAGAFLAGVSYPAFAFGLLAAMVWLLPRPGRAATRA